eukprot:TRINITY_DN9366_c0_g1_i1.p1 TRINITY_DN9366_c0_g1~~TRINITY_DN9366_c0_g1_i1.p1  ORF type:complete len:282 (-),score=56.57 TRINITY_DN9366_c0_g1_i1:76-795(-)
MDDVYNLHRTAQAIVQQAPDIVGLQEVDNCTSRHPGDDQPALLSSLTGMPFYRYGKMRDFEGGGYGIAILSKHPILDTRVLRYNKPGTNTPPEDCGTPADKDFCQGALAVLVNVTTTTSGPLQLWFVTTHLGLQGAQEDETKQLVPFLTSLGSHVVLCGDMNSVPTDPAMQVLRDAHLQDMWQSCGTGPGFTFNSAAPFERIDFIYRAPKLAPVKCNAFVPDTQASDHRPLVLDVTVLE